MKRSNAQREAHLERTGHIQKWLRENRRGTARDMCEELDIPARALSGTLKFMLANDMVVACGTAQDSKYKNYINLYRLPTANEMLAKQKSAKRDEIKVDCPLAIILGYGRIVC